MTTTPNVLEELDLPRLLDILREEQAAFAAAEPDAWAGFAARVEENAGKLCETLARIYGEKYTAEHLEDVLRAAAQAWAERPAEFKAVGQERLETPLWFQGNQMMGGVCYVDLFAGDLEGIRKRVPYLKELGLTYLHLMPLFLHPTEKHDGGYAVSSYRQVDPSVGSNEQLFELTRELHENGIALVLDFVFNHTSDEHEWAKKARQGEAPYPDYYFIFPDRTMPDAYGAKLRDIFPEERQGCFTYIKEIDRWVWTTFHSFQWDLNYQNPALFNQMAREMFAIANMGVDVLRLDAVGFTWKELGTTCENRPQAHWLIQALYALARTAAPGLVFKSEAIMHPDEVAKYIGAEECQLSYNPLLMASLWEALASGDVGLLGLALRKRFGLPEGTAWVNYLRSHDDIGWGFADEDAEELSINGFEHRQFLNAFYTGQVEGSFARGLLFQYNPNTQDARISGTLASLAGLESALESGSAEAVDLAVQRILLLHSVILSIGGIPLIYLGDEIGTLNDYSYQTDGDKKNDSRWVHRPKADWGKFEARHDAERVEGRIFAGLQRLIQVRQVNAVFSGQETNFPAHGNSKVLVYERGAGEKRMLVLANFSAGAQSVPAKELLGPAAISAWKNLVDERELILNEELVLKPYEFLWLQPVN